MRIFGKTIRFQQRKVPTITLLMLVILATAIFIVNYRLLAYEDIKKYSQERLDIPEEEQKATLIYARTVKIQHDMQAKIILSVSILMIVIFIIFASHHLYIEKPKTKNPQPS